MIAFMLCLAVSIAEDDQFTLSCPMTPTSFQAARSTSPPHACHTVGFASFRDVNLRMWDVISNLSVHYQERLPWRELRTLLIVH